MWRDRAVAAAKNPSNSLIPGEGARKIRVCYICAMSQDKYRTVRLRRADVNRIEVELEKLGGMYLTDWGTAVSYMTAREIFKMRGKSGYRKMIEWQKKGQKQREAGELPDQYTEPPGMHSIDEEARINEQNTADDADRE